MSDLFVWLMDETGFSKEDLDAIIRTAPRRYKTYEIDKRSGGKREIAQPAKEVKFLQYLLMEKILRDRPVHFCAKAYKKDTSILDNAKVHAGKSPVLKMDFKDFFPSIHGVDWRRYCLKHKLMDMKDIEISSSIFFRKAKREKTLKLSIGAPSSPTLCNILLYEFDEYVFEKARSKKIRYTRYADDMTFSGQRIGMLKDMLRVVEAGIRQTMCPKLSINDKKTNFVTTRFQRNVTGLVLSNDGEVGIGRDKERLLRARVHHAVTGRLTNDELKKLSGYLSFVKSVDLEAYDRLKYKYGSENINLLMKS